MVSNDCLPFAWSTDVGQGAGNTNDLSDDSEQEDKVTEQYSEHYSGDNDDVVAWCYTVNEEGSYNQLQHAQQPGYSDS